MAECVPSKVIHLRNLPEDCSEADLRALCEVFGCINRFLYMSRKQQALVEFTTIEEADSMLSSLEYNPIRLGNR